MFTLSVVEHLRIDFGLVVQNYTVHARAAERLASMALRAKLAILVLLSTATGAMVVSLFRPGRAFQIVAAVLAGLALAGHGILVTLSLETRVYAHRSLAHRLWLMCERYRSLLSEIHDGLVGEAAILQRRDALSEQVHAIYDPGCSVDQQAYESLRQLPFDPHIASAEQIDQLLPESARKAG